MHAERRRGRSRTRVLYWFRTPPGVKVGRTALDDDAIRRIEQQNPDLEFDWPKILKGGGAPPTEPKVPFDARRPRSGVRPRTPDPSPARDHRGLTPIEPAPTSSEAPAQPFGGQASAQPASERPDEWGLTPMDLPADGTPAHEKLGQEGVQRLRQRYADVRARIQERGGDQRRDELLASAEHLNPDAWKTAEEVAAGLEQYESVLASLREVVGRKRRRRKRGGGRRPDTAPAASGAEAPPAEAGESGDGDDAPGDDPEPDDGPGDFGSGDS